MNIKKKELVFETLFIKEPNQIKNIFDISEVEFNQIISIYQTNINLIKNYLDDDSINDISKLNIKDKENFLFLLKLYKNQFIENIRSNTVSNITKDNVEDIKKLLKLKVSIKDIANLYNVKTYDIYRTSKDSKIRQHLNLYDDVLNIVELYKSKSIIEISELYQYNYDYIYRILAKYYDSIGEKMPDRKFRVGKYSSDKVKENLFKDYIYGYTTKELAQSEGITENYVKEILRKYCKDNNIEKKLKCSERTISGLICKYKDLNDIYDVAKLKNKIIPTKIIMENLKKYRKDLMVLIKDNGIYNYNFKEDISISKKPLIKIKFNNNYIKGK